MSQLKRMFQIQRVQRSRTKNKWAIKFKLILKIRHWLKDEIIWIWPNLTIRIRTKMNLILQVFPREWQLIKALENRTLGWTEQLQVNSWNVVVKKSMILISKLMKWGRISNLQKLWILLKKQWIVSLIAEIYRPGTCTTRWILIRAS